jgi:hypothetical protein
LIIKNQLGYSKLSPARATARADFSRAMCRLHRNPKTVIAPIFVALGDETDMEDNRYKYHA